MLRKTLRALGFVAYLGFVVAVFGLAAYVSFSLFVRSGVTRTPALVGIDLDDARDLLADQGLEMRAEEGGRYNSEVPANHVVQQNPSEGTLVKRGSAVVVVSSLGPQRVEVPSLAGQGLQSAQVLLDASGLTLGRTVEIYGNDAPPGSVVAQQPTAGETVSPGAAIDLLLARADSLPAYVMPDLVYRDYDTVRRFFESQGFQLGSVKYERYEGVRAGVILRQFPRAGHPLDRRESISLVVAARPDPEPESNPFPPSAG